MGYIVSFSDSVSMGDAINILTNQGYAIVNVCSPAKCFVVECTQTACPALRSLPGVYDVREELTYRPLMLDESALPKPRRILSLQEAFDLTGLHSESRGEGVRVGILGTGVDEGIVGGRVEHVNLTDEPGDLVGHETAIAGIIRALAPDATIVDVHMMTNGEAKSGVVLQALAEVAKYDVDCLNLSLGSDEPASTGEPVSRMLDVLAGMDIPSVVASGNRGVVEAPAGASQTIAVGSVNSLLLPSVFSGRGTDANGRIRPDISAPGGDAHEALALRTTGRLSTRPGLRGTSFSAGFVTGYLATVWDQLTAPRAFAAEGLMQYAGTHPGYKGLDGWGAIRNADADVFDVMRRIGPVRMRSPI